MNKRNTVSLSPILFAVCIFASGCTSSGKIVEGINKDDLIYAKTTANDAASRNFRDVLTKDGLTLMVNDQTVEIAVRDRNADVVWYSNPQERENDPTASEDNKQNMAAQARILYSDKTGAVRSMNTYTDAVAKGQYRITTKGSVLSVQYSLGTVEERALVPVVVEKKRFEELVLKNLDETSKKTLDRYYMLIDLKTIQDQAYRQELEAKYPAAKKGPVWALRSNPPAPNIARAVQEVIRKTAYTQEDLDADNVANGVQNSNNDVVFNLTICYTIENGHLVVTVPADKIQMPDDYLIERMILLEHFGAAQKGSKGYALLPDGSGSLMYFDNGKDALSPYSVPVYGNDKSLYIEETPYKTDQINLPVFGLKNGNAAFLAVIEQGDALANIDAHSSGTVTSYNTVYPEFRVREKAVQSIGSKENIQDIYQKERYKGNLTVSYYFLSGENANYVGMAKTYKSLLLNGCKASLVGMRPLYLDFIGAVDATKNFAGISYDATRVLTSFKAAQQICNDIVSNIKTEKSELIVQYSGMINGGIRQSYADSVKVMKQLGGLAGFKDFLSDMNEQGMQVYPDVDLLYTYRNSLFGSYNVQRDSARFLVRTTAKVYPYNPATFTMDEKASPYFIISPQKYGSLFSSFMKSYKQLGCPAISLKSIGKDLNADYRETEVINRQEAQSRIVEGVKSLAGDYSLMVENGNSYTLPIADHVVSVPMDSCGYDACDESIPFLQIVLSGRKNFAGDSINLMAVDRHLLLKSIETGAGLSFTVTNADGDTVRDTKYSQYFSVSYESIKQTMASALEEVDGAASFVGKEITQHIKLGEGVYQTTFEGGGSIVVNYNKQVFTGNGLTVGAEDFVVLGG